MKHPYEDIETFIKEKMPNVSWEPRKSDIIYLSPTERLVVTVERGTAPNAEYFGYPLYRYDILEAAGVLDWDVDAVQRANDIFDVVFDHMSVHDMVEFGKVMNKYINDWNQRRIESGHGSYFESERYEAIRQDGADSQGKV